MAHDEPLPVLGFVATSGTGKTTLLTRLLPLLKARGLRCGVVKHSHHDFAIDIPGKDSYRLREAGADQVMLADKIIQCVRTHERRQWCVFLRLLLA